MQENLEAVREVIRRHVPTDIWVQSEKKGCISRLLRRPTDVDMHRVDIMTGQTVTKVMIDLARLRYPPENLPRYVAGHGVTRAEADAYMVAKTAPPPEKKGKAKEPKAEKAKNVGDAVILTRIDPTWLSGRVDGEIQTRCCVKRKYRDRFTHASLAAVSDSLLAGCQMTEGIHEVNVDLCLVLGGVTTIMESKAGGRVDGGKCKQTVQHCILKPYVCLGAVEKRVFLGLTQDELGFGRNGEWRGSPTGLLTPEMILIEDELYDLVLPRDVPFTSFCLELAGVINSYRPSPEETIKAMFAGLGEAGKGEVLAAITKPAGDVDLPQCPHWDSPFSRCDGKLSKTLETGTWKTSSRCDKCNREFHHSRLHMAA